MPRLGSGIALVARTRELRGLRAALAAAVDGHAGAVLLAGDAGVGKTRMTEEIALVARDADVTVLLGRCLDAGETGLPYLPIAEALAPARDRTASRPALSRLFPEAPVPDPERAVGSAAALPGPRPEQDLGQLRLFDAVLGVLGDLAEEAPVLLVLEDLHWADASTRSLLSFLVSRLRSQRLLVVGTYRSDDLHRRHPLRPLLAELVRHPRVERVELAPFGQADARAFVAALAEDRVPDQVVREVAGRSEGNAFFAEELLDACADGGIPATLVDVLLARVERLSPAAQGIVRVAAVAGRRVPDPRLRAVAGLDDARVEDALREAVQHHVLVPSEGDVYSFRHALLREAVYGDLLPGERVRLHAAYARQLAERVGDRGVAAALAHHSLESNDLPRALSASIDASAEAERLGAPAESLEHVERALRLWPSVPEADRPRDVDELTLLRRASWVAGTSGNPERAIAFAQAALDRVDEADSPELAAKLAWRLALASYALDGRNEESVSAIERARALVVDRPMSATQAWVLAASASVSRALAPDVPVERIEEWAERAVEVARAVGVGGPEADALVTLAVLAERRGEAERARDLLVAARDRAHAADALTVELRAQYVLAMHLYETGDVAASARAVQAGVARARDTGLTWSSYGLELRVLEVIIHFTRGAWDEAELAAEPPGHRVSNTVAARLAAVGASVAVGRGRFAEAERLVSELREDWHRDNQIPLMTAGAGAELALWRGKPERAAEWIAEALDWVAHSSGPIRMVTIRLAALGVAAHADIAAADQDAARVAVVEGARLADLAHRTVATGQPRTGELGPEGRAWLARLDAELSRLRDHDDPAAWERAVAAFDYGAVYEQALCRYRHAEALLIAERRDEAAAELRAAHEVAGALVARPLKEAVARIARRARISLSDNEIPRDQVDPLTPREHAVLALVAEGNTNRQVGERLFISEKTVSVHLSRAMAKLGASRRAEAVAIAHGRGLLTTPEPSGA